MLTLLCQQASISIANALLFRSVQTGTRENLKMIAAQKEALEAARRSREDALKATKVRGTSSFHISAPKLGADQKQLSRIDEP
jgi:GAF domain-containing protein